MIVPARLYGGPQDGSETTVWCPDGRAPAQLRFATGAYLREDLAGQKAVRYRPRLHLYKLHSCDLVLVGGAAVHRLRYDYEAIS